MKNEDVIKLLLNSGKETREYMSQISNGVSKLNDTNLLHAKTIDILRVSIEDNTKASNAFLAFNKYLLLLAVSALVVLSGAEKIFELLKP